jgi:hypothetical protein
LLGCDRQRILNVGKYRVEAVLRDVFVDTLELRELTGGLREIIVEDRRSSDEFPHPILDSASLLLDLGDTRLGVLPATGGFAHDSLGALP